MPGEMTAAIFSPSIPRTSRKSFYEYFMEPLGLANSTIRGLAFAFRAVGEIANGFSRICLFSYSLGSASSLVRLLALWVRAVGETTNAFSLRSEGAALAVRLGSDNSIVRLEATINVNQVEAKEGLRFKIKGVPLCFSTPRGISIGNSLCSCETSRSVGFANALVRRVRFTWTYVSCGG
uniref:Uncharacterized protein n=1 Tax=Glossina austeni TaxID=7395 RepID=A0A1A9UWZ6_GLOAU